MSKEKRGTPFPDGTARDEAKLLGPYPIWDAWKHVLLKEFPQVTNNGTEELLKLYYIARRLDQKRSSEQGVVGTSAVKEFMDKVEKEDPSFFKRCGSQIIFIRERTKIEIGGKR